MKKFLGLFLLITSAFLAVNIALSATNQSTEAADSILIEDPDGAIPKSYEELSASEKRHIKKVEKAQIQKRSFYEKRARKHLKNDQPKTYEDYHKIASDFKTNDMADVDPTFKKDERLEKAPNPRFEVVRYNYPAGSRELNLSTLKSNRYARSQGVLSPDGKMVVFTEVNYEVGIRKASSSAYIIPILSKEDIAKMRVENLHKREDRLRELTENIEKNKDKLSAEEKKEIKQKIKKLRQEIEEIKAHNEEKEKDDNVSDQKDTPAQKLAKALLRAHIKDKIKDPILSVGLFDKDYGIQRTLTVVDWSLNSKRILFKEKISKEGSGIWQTNLWVYDLETGESKKLDEVRQAIEYYWKKDRMIDLYNYRYDLYPLGWDAKHSDRILLYAYGYTKRKGDPPKFLGTWSIDYKGEQSQLISVTKTGYILQANGYCLKTRNIEYYEK